MGGTNGGELVSLSKGPVRSRTGMESRCRTIVEGGKGLVYRRGRVGGGKWGNRYKGRGNSALGVVRGIKAPGD